MTDIRTKRKAYQKQLRSTILDTHWDGCPIRKCIVDMTAAGLMPQTPHGHFSVTIFLDTENDRKLFESRYKEDFVTFCRNWVEDQVSDMGFGEQTQSAFLFGSVEDIEANHDGDYTYNLR